jgi:hypothetical protein
VDDGIAIERPLRSEPFTITEQVVGLFGAPSVCSMGTICCARAGDWVWDGKQASTDLATRDGCINVIQNIVVSPQCMGPYDHSYVQFGGHVDTPPLPPILLTDTSILFYHTAWAAILREGIGCLGKGFEVLAVVLVGLMEVSISTYVLD